MATLAHLKAKDKYEKKNVQQFIIKYVIKNNLEVVEKLKTVPNRSGYVRELVLADLAKEKGGSTFDFPQIKFKPFKKDATEDDLYKYICNHGRRDALVYLRYKYDFEEKWTYETEAVGVDDNGICWFNDWDEGQENIEFLAIAEFG